MSDEASTLPSADERALLFLSLFFAELAKFDSLTGMDAIQKLEKAVQPCLNQITWKQLIMIKRVVTAVYLTMDEIVQELVQNIVGLE